MDKHRRVFSSRAEKEFVLIPECEFYGMYQYILQLSSVLPMMTEEIAAIVATSGQSGIHFQLKPGFFIGEGDAPHPGRIAGRFWRHLVGSPRHLIRY